MSILNYPKEPTKMRELHYIGEGDLSITHGSQPSTFQYLLDYKILSYVTLVISYKKLLKD